MTVENSGHTAPAPRAEALNLLSEGDQIHPAAEPPAEQHPLAVGMTSTSARAQTACLLGDLPNDTVHEPQAREGSSFVLPSDLSDGTWLDPTTVPTPATIPTVSSDLRKRIMRAIFDPGATEGFKGNRDLTTWQTDAVMRVLATTEGSADE